MNDKDKTVTGWQIAGHVIVFLLQVAACCLGMMDLMLVIADYDNPG